MMRELRRWLCWLLPALLLFACVQAAQVDYFGRSVAPPASAVASAPAQPAVALPQLDMVPAPLRGLASATISAQIHINAAIRSRLEQARNGDGAGAVWGIVLLSLAYGVLHALGPGHGKFVIGSYFLTQHARIGHGLALSGWAALVQALTAIVLVGVGVPLFSVSARGLLGHAATLEMVSYAAIALYGVIVLRRLLAGLDSCGCDPDDGKTAVRSPLQAPRRSAGQAAGLGRVRFRAVAAASSAPHTLRQMFMAGSAIGLRPCSGALIVLLFCLANHMFHVGVLATLAMGVGVMITVSAVSLGSLGLQRWLGHRFAAGAGRWRRWTSYAGAGAIILFGALQVVLLASGLLPPIAT